MGWHGDSCLMQDEPEREHQKTRLGVYWAVPRIANGILAYID